MGAIGLPPFLMSMARAPAFWGLGGVEPLEVVEDLPGYLRAV